MKREIKFRGKTNRGAWIYGNLGTYKNTFNGKLIDEKCVIFQDISQFQTDNFCYVLEDYRVMKDTIGQYTGLKDKNGKEIYEGDIVVFDNIMWDNQVCTCQWDESAARFQLVTNELPFGDTISMYESETINMEVVDNIYDNPELLNNKQYGKEN